LPEHEWRFVETHRHLIMATDCWLRRPVQGLDLTTGELDRVCTPPDTPGYPTRPHSVLECLHVILNEEWEHHRYTVRDLDALTG
jgi:hypothetical protein